MPTDKFMFECDICGSQYQHGPHRYEGHKLALYGDMWACESCWRGNHDGWAPQYEAALHASLEKNALPTPKRNQNGFLPRD